MDIYTSIHMYGTFTTAFTYFFSAIWVYTGLKVGRKQVLCFDQNFWKDCTHDPGMSVLATFVTGVLVSILWPLVVVGIVLVGTSRLVCGALNKVQYRLMVRDERKYAESPVGRYSVAKKSIENWQAELSNMTVQEQVLRGSYVNDLQSLIDVTCSMLAPIDAAVEEKHSQIRAIKQKARDENWNCYQYLYAEERKQSKIEIAKLEREVNKCIEQLMPPA